MDEALRRVLKLEETVMKGSLEDLKGLLAGGAFEVTARALGLAVRYRGLDFVRELVSHGASFTYDTGSRELCRKYSLVQRTDAGTYCTEFYLLAVPEKLDLENSYPYLFTPLYGIIKIPVLAEAERAPLSLEERMQAAAYLSGQDAGLSLDEMLFWSLGRGEISCADALMELGADLNRQPPSYSDYGVWTWLDIITSGMRSIYWNEYVYRLSMLEEDRLLPVLSRFAVLAETRGRRLVLDQKMTDQLKWNDRSLPFALQHMDSSGVDRKKALESVISRDQAAALAVMADSGWLGERSLREAMIRYARENKYNEALAWLMDFKSRTVDTAAEAAEEEARMFQMLMEDPASESALRRKWDFALQEDGSLLVTAYKGSEEEILLPASVGDKAVTAVADMAFSAGKGKFSRPNGSRNRRIRSVIIPEGIRSIGENAFRDCALLERLELPSSVRQIGAGAFAGCEKLKDLTLPEQAVIGDRAFAGCRSLPAEQGFLIYEHTLYACFAPDGQDLVIPDGVTAIAGGAFFRKNMASLLMPQSLEQIGEGALRMTTGLRRLVLPGGLRRIPADAFADSDLEEISLPQSIEEIGDRSFFYLEHLKTIQIPGSVCRIGKDAFYHTGLERIEFAGNGLRVIAQRAFKYVRDLQEIDLPAGLEQIGDGAFAYSGLKNITLPEGLQEIGPAAFECTELEEIRIPESVRTVGRRALRACPRLRDIFIPGPETEPGPQLLGHEDSRQDWRQLTVHTPAGSAAEKDMREHYPDIKLADDCM